MAAIIPPKILPPKTLCFIIRGIQSPRNGGMPYFEDTLNVVPSEAFDIFPEESVRVLEAKDEYGRPFKHVVWKGTILASAWTVDLSKTLKRMVNWVGGRMEIQIGDNTLEVDGLKGATRKAMRRAVRMGEM